MGKTVTITAAPTVTIANDDEEADLEAVQPTLRRESEGEGERGSDKKDDDEVKITIFGSLCNSTPLDFPNPISARKG